MILLSLAKATLSFPSYPHHICDGVSRAVIFLNFGVDVEGVDPSVIGRGKTGVRMA